MPSAENAIKQQNKWKTVEYIIMKNDIEEKWIISDLWNDTNCAL